MTTPEPDAPETGMSVEVAFQNISDVCAQFRGTLGEHQLLQTALGVVYRKIIESPLEDVKSNGRKRAPADAS